MNLEDLAKKTIDEINSQIQFQEEKQEDEIIIIEEDQQKQMQENIQLVKNTLEDIDNILVDEIKTKEEKQENTSIQEDIFLKNIRERILVLFEGLKETKTEDLDLKVDMIINFLEFLLANIEDKLKK